MSKDKSFEYYYILLRRKIIRPILNNEKLACFISKHCLKTYLAMFYENWLGKRLDMRHPRDINEQLMRLSVEAKNDPVQHQLRVLCADKNLVREYVTKKGMADILIPSYGTHDSFDEIDFDKLPDRFVVQYNFGCGMIWICKDKSTADIDKWRKRFAEWDRLDDFGLESGEWQYSEMPHKLVITKYLDSLGATSVNDYKFHCMNGQVYGCLAITNRIVGTHHMNLDHYDLDWNLTDGIRPAWHTQYRKEVAKPTNYDRMLEVARTLSKDFPYCRVDLYEADEQVYFGELTFTPQGNVMNYYTDEMLQDMLRFYNDTK